MRTVFVIALASVGLLFSATVKSESYRVSPGSTLAIGHGFDPREPRRVFLECLDYDGLWNTSAPRYPKSQLTVADPEFKNAAGFAVETTQISSRKQLYEFIGLSASVSGGNAFFSGGASYLSEDEYKFDENSYHYGVKAWTNFGDFRLINPRLSADAQVALYRGPGAFFERCGMEFVGQETRGASIAVVYSVHTLDQEKRHRVEASLKAGFGAGSWGGDIDFDYKEVLMEALRTDSLRVHVYGYGGPGASELAPLIENSADVSEVKKLIRSYLGGLTVEGSIPIAYNTGNFTSVEPRLGALEFGGFNKHLAEYTFAYEDLLSYRASIRRVLQGEYSSRISEGDRERFLEAFDQASALSASIERKAIDCRHNLSARIADVTVSNKPAPVIDRGIQCESLSSSEMTFSLPSLPNVIPFTVQYWTGTKGVVPIHYVSVSVRGRHLSQVLLVGGYNGNTRTHMKVLDTMEVSDASSTGDYVAQGNYDLGKVRPEGPIAVAVRGKDGFVDYVEILLPSENPDIAGTIEAAIMTSPEENLRIQKLQAIKQ